MKSVSERWVCYSHNQEHSLHFELLFNGLAETLEKLHPFQNLTYFFTWWPRYLTIDLENISIMYKARIHPRIWRRYVKAFLSYAWKCVYFILIWKNIDRHTADTIVSWPNRNKMGNRRLILSSWCDVIADIINMKILLMHDLDMVFPFNFTEN